MFEAEEKLNWILSQLLDNDSKAKTEEIQSLESDKADGGLIVN